MSNKQTKTYTRRADAMDSKEFKRSRLAKLKSLHKALTPEQLEEMAQLMREVGNG
jgi:hypothetical protein